MSKRTQLLSKLKHVYSHNTKLVLDVSNDDIGLIIEALEKQVAKKIEEHNKTCKCRVFDYMDYECTQRVPYCCVCGQKIDWSEVDDHN